MIDRPASRARLNRLWQRGCRFLGTPYAIMGGAMSWVSERSLVSSISNNGGFGVLASGSMPPELLAAEIAATARLTNAPFGVNLIIIHPELDALIAVCLDLRVSHVVLAGGVPTAAIIQRLKQGNVRVLCFAPTLAVGRRLVRAGADALIIEGSEAGGHIGSVSTSVLAQEILPVIRETPVFVAGGIGHGGAIRAYLEHGASGCQIGTRFVCAHASIAHPNFKQAFLRAHARDAQPSVQIDPEFPVIPVRAIANQATKRFIAVQRAAIDRYHQGLIGQRDALLEIERFWAGALRAAVIEGNVEEGSLMAGQSVGLVTREQSTAEIIEELVDQACQRHIERDSPLDRPPLDHTEREPHPEPRHRQTP